MSRGSFLTLFFFDTFFLTLFVFSDRQIFHVPRVESISPSTSSALHFRLAYDESLHVLQTFDGHLQESCQLRRLPLRAVACRKTVTISHKPCGRVAGDPCQPQGARWAPRPRRGGGACPSSASRVIGEPMRVSGMSCLPCGARGGREGGLDLGATLASGPDSRPTLPARAAPATRLLRPAAP